MKDRQGMAVVRSARRADWWRVSSPEAVWALADERPAASVPPPQSARLPRVTVRVPEEHAEELPRFAGELRCPPTEWTYFGASGVAPASARAPSCSSTLNAKRAASSAIPEPAEQTAFNGASRLRSSCSNSRRGTPAGLHRALAGRDGAPRLRRGLARAIG